MPPQEDAGGDSRPNPGWVAQHSLMVAESDAFDQLRRRRLEAWRFRRLGRVRYKTKEEAHSGRNLEPPSWQPARSVPLVKALIIVRRGADFRRP
jgi:hypothetical protein